MTYLLDTNVVTYILKKNLLINNKLEEMRRLGKKAFISCITYYEVKRGLIAINATKQLSEFNQLCQRYKVLLLDDIEIIERSSEIHLDLKRRGNSLEDADILIAATAITRR